MGLVKNPNGHFDMEIHSSTGGGYTLVFHSPIYTVKKFNEWHELVSFLANHMDEVVK